MAFIAFQKTIVPAIIYCDIYSNIHISGQESNTQAYYVKPKSVPILKEGDNKKNLGSW